VVACADAIWASLLASVPVGSITRVLDFGCGTALLTKHIFPRVRELLAVDASLAMVEVLAAKALPNFRFGVAKWTLETIAGSRVGWDRIARPMEDRHMRPLMGIGRRARDGS
jgi:SAM-dependent methyltransferase